jgi:hypothetical protein
MRILQNGVVSHFAPELQSNYGKAQFAFSMLLFGVAQRDFDTAVPDLVDANTTLRSLLGDVARSLAAIDRNDAREARERTSALPGTADSLRLSALRAENDALRAALASLAPVVEPAADDAGLAPLRDVRERIYAYLSADARKRIVPILSA